jgi:hypothetical protein
MASWSEFAAAEPELAASVQALVHQYGQGFGYLATVRADGGPRVHPVSPVIAWGGLYCFVVDSPKRRDLDRDGRYALHSFPPEQSSDEAYLTGRARAVTDRARVLDLAGLMRAAPTGNWRVYEFTVDVAMLVHGGDAQVWRDPALRGNPGGARPLQKCAAGPERLE